MELTGRSNELLALSGVKAWFSICSLHFAKTIMKNRICKLYGPFNTSFGATTSIFAMKTYGFGNPPEWNQLLDIAGDRWRSQ